MADLATQDTLQLSKEGARMEIIDVRTKHVLTHEKDDVDDYAMYLILKGPDSPDVHRQMANVRARAALDKKDKGKTQSDESIEKDREFDSKLIARLVVGGEVFWKDEWLVVTKENAYDLLHSFSTIRTQALAFIMDSGNFTKG